jgi:Zn-dependent peptidase ImmA (M78 family)
MKGNTMKKKLKILGMNYTIHYLEQPVLDGSVVCGYCDPNEQVIVINSTKPDQAQRITLIHEILHAIFEALGFMEEYTNERLITSLATSLHQVFNDNKL